MKTLSRYSQVIYLVALLALILIHGFADTQFKIDNTTLILIGLILILPYLPLIKKIKLGDFEAEITHEEVSAIKEQVSSISSENEITFTPDTYSELEELTQKDPQLALSKVRIELEKRINTLYETYNKNEDRVADVKDKIEYLNQAQILRSEIVAPLKEIINITTRAIHGEEITIENSRILIETAVTLYKELDHAFIEHTLTTAKVTTISPEEARNYQQATYEVTTILQEDEQAEKHIYQMNQSELDAFLERYTDYIEYIISITKI